MKLVLLVFGLALALEGVYGDNSTVVTNTTTEGSGMEDSSSTTSFGGGTAEPTMAPNPGCAEKVVNVNSLIVHQDVEDCDNYTATNYTIVVVFSASKLGNSSTSDIACKETCDGSAATRAIGAAQCLESGEWAEPIWSDCSKNASQQNITEKLNNAFIDTSDPDDITENIVSPVVEVLKQAAEEENITKATADTFTATINNLMQATDDDARKALKSNFSSLVDSVDEVAKKVDLVASSDNSYYYYESVSSNMALAVVGDSAPARIKALPEHFYFGTETEWTGDYNLAASSLTLGTEEPRGAYIQATAASDERLSFEMYSQAQSISSNVENIVATTVVYSVNGASGDFNMTFQLSRTISTTEDGIFDRTDNSYQKLQCIRLLLGSNGKENLDANSCQAVSAQGVYANCTCNKPGQYTVRQLKIVDDSLTGGEIAGITIGSIAAAALIAGGIYCLFCKKDSSSTHSSSSGL